VRREPGSRPRILTFADARGGGAAATAGSNARHDLVPYLGILVKLPPEHPCDRLSLAENKGLRISDESVKRRSAERSRA
jgi:hypothetical protein